MHPVDVDIDARRRHRRSNTHASLGDRTTHGGADDHAVDSSDCDAVSTAINHTDNCGTIADAFDGAICFTIRQPIGSSQRYTNCSAKCFTERGPDGFTIRQPISSPQRYADRAPQCDAHRQAINTPQREPNSNAD